MDSDGASQFSTACEGLTWLPPTPRLPEAQPVTQQETRWGVGREREGTRG